MIKPLNFIPLPKSPEPVLHVSINVTAPRYHDNQPFWEIRYCNPSRIVTISTICTCICTESAMGFPNVHDGWWDFAIEVACKRVSCLKYA